MTHSATSSNPSAKTVRLPEATPEQQRVVERIAVQRDRLRARRAAHAQSLALADRNPGLGAIDESFVLRAAGFTREHPVAVAAMAGIALVAGPRRLVRWAGVLLPMLMKFRR